MPIFLKSIESNIISLFGDGSTDFNAPVSLITSIIGELGVEDYIKLTTFEALTQDFSNVGHAEFCDKPLNYGLNSCPSYLKLNISL